MDVAKLRVLVEAETRQAEAALQRVNTQFVALSSAAQRSSSGVAAVTSRIEFQQRQLGILQKELEGITKKYTEGSVQAEKKKLQIDKLSSSIQTLSTYSQNQIAAARQLNTFMQQVATTSQSTADATNRLNATFKDGAVLAAGARLFHTIVDGASSATGAIITLGSNYQSSMAVLQSTSSATNAQMQLVAATSKALGADLALPATSAAGAADAMTALAQNGLSVSEAMAAARGTLQLAAAGMISEAEAATYTAGALNAFRLAGTDATRVADMLAASVSASGSSIQQTGLALQQAAAVYASAGIPIEQLTALIGEMSQAGIRGSDAGTSLKTMLLKLEAPVDAAKKQLQDMGVAVYDASGKMLPLRDIIGQLSDATKTMSQQQRDGALATIFGSDAIRAANIIIAEGVEGYDRMLEAVTKQGAAGDLAAARMKGLGGAVEGLKSQLETAALNGIEPLLPMLEALVRHAAELAGALAENIGPAMTTVASALQTGAQVVSTLFLPAVIGLTAAAGAYGIAAIAAIPPTLALGTALGTAALAAGAAAVSFLAVAIPLAAIAVSVGAVVLGIQNYNQQVKDTIGATLDLAKGYTGTTDALNTYQAAQQKLAELGPQQRVAIEAERIIIQQLRGELEKVTAAYYAVGGGTEENRQRMYALNAQLKEHDTRFRSLTEAGIQLADANRIQRQQLQAQTDAFYALEAGTADANGALTEMTEAQMMQVRAAQLSQEELDKLNKELERLAKEGPKAFGEMINAEVSFGEGRVSARAEHAQKIDALERELGDAVGAKARAAVQKRIDAENSGYRDAEQSAAQSYARQQAAATQHYGQMLIDYFQYEGKRRGLTDGQIRAITDALRVEYGVHESIQSQAYSRIMGNADALIASGGKNVDAFIAQSRAALSLTIEQEERYNQLMEAGTANLQRQYDDRKISLDQYKQGLLDLPREVNSQVVLETQKAQADAAATQERIDRIPNHVQSEIFLKTNEVDLGVSAVHTQLATVPTAIYTNAMLDAKNAQMEAGAYHQTLAATPPVVGTSVELRGVEAATTAARALGNDLAAGVAVGIAAAQARLNGAMTSAMAQAITAGRGAVKAKSPAQVPAELIGEPIAEGVALGINRKRKLIGDALGGALKTSVDAAGTAGVFDTINKIVETIGKAVDVLGKLNTFKAPTRAALESFSFLLRDVVVDFGHRAKEAQAYLNQTSLDFAAVAGASVDVIGKGVDALGKLRDWEAPTRDSLLSFSYAARDAAADAWHRAQDVRYLLKDQAAETFSTTASAALDTIGKGVDALAKLKNFIPPTRESLMSFSVALRDLVADFWHRSQEVLYALSDEAAPMFAEVGGKAVDTIGKGVEAFAKLKDFVSPTREQVALFSLALRDLVVEFIQRTAEFDTNLLAAAAQFAESGGKAVQVVAGGVEAFQRLQGYAGVPQAALQMFAADLDTTIRLMGQMAAHFDEEGLAKATAFADASGRVVAPIKAGVESFAALKDYERVASDRMQALFGDLQLATGLMVQIAAAADSDGVKAAAAFSTSVKTVFDAMKSGIDALDALRDYESVPRERMDAVLTDFQAALGLMQKLAQSAQAARSEGQAWKAALEAFASDVRAGLAAVASIDGLSVNVSASVSASTSAAPVGEASSSAPAPEARAKGGDVFPGRAYAVGDNADGSWNSTTELFVPRTPGSILSAPTSRAVLAQLSQDSNAGSPVVTGGDTIIQPGAIQLIVNNEMDLERAADYILDRIARKNR